MTLRWDKRTGLATLGLLGLLGFALWVGWGPSGADASKPPYVENSNPALSSAGTAPDGLVALQASALNPLPGQCREKPAAARWRMGSSSDCSTTTSALSASKPFQKSRARYKQVLAENLRPAPLPQAQRLLDRYIAFKAALLRLEQVYAKKPEGRAQFARPVPGHAEFA